MDHQTQCELIEELLALKAEQSAFLDEKAVRVPVTHYTDEARFAKEQAMIFRRVPLAAAHVSELPEPDSFVSRELMGRSVLLTRDGQGDIHAFLNVCRHRGTRLVEDGEGCKKRFSCPYHAWTYSNQGALVAAPHFDAGFPDQDKAALGLTRLPVRELFGFIWVVLTPETSPDQEIDFAAAFDGLAGDLTALGMADMAIVHETQELRRTNWKILVEGGIEAYHFKVAHRATIGPYFEDNLSSYRCFGPHMRSILARSSLTELTPETRQNWRLRDHANVLYTLFPASQLLVQQDHIVWVSQQPVAAGETRLRLATLVPQDQAADTAHWERNHAITLTTLSEDFAIGESIYANLDSGANTHLTFGRFEGALDRFNRTIESCLADA
ncbi:MAG: aromatic ring-hydroxylating oxygenase subunit alpha [Parvibaculales bacterium]